jgi:hypothetical protein
VTKARRTEGNAARRKKSGLMSYVKKNKFGSLVAVVVLLLVVLEGQKYIGGHDDVESTGIDVEDSVPKQVMPLDNEIFFGWDNRDDYASHNFVCSTCCCDKSRKDFVYVSYGNVEFDLKVIPDRTNILTITVGNLNDNCRRNDVFVDSQLVGNLNKETGPRGKTDFQFNITPVWDKIHVKVEHVGDEKLCWWGNDLYKARIDVR